MTAPSRVAPAAAMAWGLSGLVAGELTKLVFLECCMPCTMDVLRLWAYEPDGFRSSEPKVRSGLELLLGTTTAGVCERGDRVRDEAVSARPRVWLGSREAEEGLSIWCDTFPACRACRSGKEAAADTAGVSTVSWQRAGRRQRRPRRTRRCSVWLFASTPPARVSRWQRWLHDDTVKAQAREGTYTCRQPRMAHCLGGTERTAGCPEWLRTKTAPGVRSDVCHASLW
jgi:hypothetical protein